MMPLKIGSTLAACLIVAAAAVMLEASGQSRPGEPTQARVWVENRAPNEAIPVALENTVPLRVQVAGTPTVVVDQTVPTRAARQAWEYRTISVPVGQDPANALASAGTEGWEAVGVLSTGQTATAGVAVLLKRPR